MYTLFSNPSRHYGGLVADAALRDFKKRTVEDLDRVIQYYRNGTFFTRSDHLLSRLINSVATPLSYDLDRYYEVTLARSLYVANGLQLTSSINTGKWHAGVFYFGCPELIICHNEQDSPHELIKDWRNLKPVKLLESPISNLNFLVPTGTNQQVERGTAVISIDIGMLMVMYRGFIQNEERRYRTGESEAMLATHHFIGRYVLPNMLYSQTDLAIFNRMYNLIMGKPMGHAYRRHPFSISDYTQKCDKGLEEIIRNIQNTPRTFETYLANIPSVFSDFPLGMPDMVETRQVWWALFISRVKAIEFLFDLAGERGLAFNRLQLGQLKIAMKEFESDGIFKRMLTPDQQIEINQFFRSWKAL